MKKQLLLSAILAAALATGFAFGPAAFADDMKKEGMSKMSSDKMEKSGKMDHMSDKGMNKSMKKDGMAHTDKMKDGMGK